MNLTPTHIRSGSTPRPRPHRSLRSLAPLPWLVLLVCGLLWSGCEECTLPPAEPVAPAAPPPPPPTQGAAEVAADGVREHVRPLLDGPRLRADDTLWDWGVAQGGQELRHVFVLHNDGNVAVQIKKVRPSCGCAAAEYDKEIAAGGEGRMEIVIGHAKLHHGKSTVYVEIETQDPRSDTTLILRGDVVPPENAGAITVDGGLLGR